MTAETPDRAREREEQALEEMRAKLRHPAGKGIGHPDFAKRVEARPYDPDMNSELAPDPNRTSPYFTIEGRLDSNINREPRGLTGGEWLLLMLVLGIITAMLAVAAMMIWWPTPAHAEGGSVGGPSDDGSIAVLSVSDYAFLEALDREGIAGPTDYEMTLAAGAVCTKLDSNGGDLVATTMYVYKKSSMEGVESAAFFVGASVAAYCPEYVAEAKNFAPGGKSDPMPGGPNFHT